MRAQSVWLIFKVIRHGTKAGSHSSAGRAPSRETGAGGRLPAAPGTAPRPRPRAPGPAPPPAAARRPLPAPGLPAAPRRSPELPGAPRGSPQPPAVPPGSPGLPSTRPPNTSPGCRQRERAAVPLAVFIRKGFLPPPEREQHVYSVPGRNSLCRFKKIKIKKK